MTGVDRCVNSVLQVPQYLIVHMPRFGSEFRLYDKVFPNLKLDLRDVLEGGDYIINCAFCVSASQWLRGRPVRATQPLCSSLR